MFLSKNLFCLFLCVFLFLGTHCGNSSSDPNSQNINVSISQACPSMNLVEITSDINANTTWVGNTIYIIRKWNFYVNATLVIQPGAIIKFHATEGPEMVLGGAGTIVAEGTATNPIIFTSFKDDASGCDNNGDGLATTPASGDWGSIDTNGLNGSVFEYCHFYYGGQASRSATLTLSAGSVATITHSTFAHNRGDDATGWYGALDASDAEAGTEITDNIFYDNVRPLSISVAYDLDDSNQFSNPDDATQTNTYNGVFVESINHITSHISWAETEVPFVIDDNDFWINSGATLTLADDVVLKFRPESVIVLADGTSQLIFSSNESGVAFTSYRDDSLKGDTNADGTATTPQTGDWGGIYDDTTPIGGPHYLSWSNIYYDDVH